MQLACKGNLVPKTAFSGNSGRPVGKKNMNVESFHTRYHRIIAMMLKKPQFSVKENYNRLICSVHLEVGMPCQLGDSVVPTHPHKKPAHRKSQLPRSGRPSDRNANTLPANASEPKSAPAPLPFVCQLWAPPEDPSYRSRCLAHRLSSASGLEVPSQTRDSCSDPKKTQSSSDQKGGEGEKKMEPFPEPRHWYEVVGTLASERSCCHWCTLPAFTSLGLPQRNSFDSFVTGVQRGKF